MSEPIKFPKDKSYKNFGNLLADILNEKDDYNLDCGIIVLFNEDNDPTVLPICTTEQCAYIAARLLRLASDD